MTLTPGGRAPITLLPTFSGFGTLAADAVRLLPRALQAIVDALSPPSALLAGGLRVAQHLGIYSPANGFEGAAEAAELARMVEPGWLASKAAAAPAIAAELAGLFGGGSPIAISTGVISPASTGQGLRWAYPAGARP